MDKEQQILQVALNLFLEKGYENVSLKDIIAKCGGSYTTIYKKFHNKEELFLHSLKLKSHERTAKLLLFLKESEKLEVDEFLQAFAHKYFACFCNKEHAKFTRLVVARSYTDSKLQDVINQADKNIVSKEFARILQSKIPSENFAKFEPIELANLFCTMIVSSKIIDFFFGSNFDVFDENCEQIKRHLDLSVSMFRQFLII